MATVRVVDGMSAAPWPNIVEGQESSDHTGFVTMADTKTKGRKLTHKERRAAQAAANRRARLQWWILGGTLAVAAVVTIVLLSVYTEGSFFGGLGG